MPNKIKEKQIKKMSTEKLAYTLPPLPRRHWVPLLLCVSNIAQVASQCGYILLFFTCLEHCAQIEHQYNFKL